MKSIYITPSLEIIKFDTRESLMISVSNSEADTSDPNFDQRSQGMHSGWNSDSWSEE